MARDGKIKIKGQLDRTEEQVPRDYTIMPGAPKLKIVVKTRQQNEDVKNTVKGGKGRLFDSEDSFDKGENPKRNTMTSTIVKSNHTSSYYMITLHYVVMGDKYLLTIKDITKHRQICCKQDIPVEFALF